MKQYQRERFERFYLWWINEKTKKRYHAGVAFRNERFGVYHLKVDCYPGRRLYLKDYKTQDDKILFRVEESIRIGVHRVRKSIGEAYSSRETKGDVEMILVPYFGAKLVLVLGEAEESG